MPLPPPRHARLPPGVARIVDANANRAREAARVLEDLARFALDNGELAGALKLIRHELRTAIEAVAPDASELLASRDTPGDVGAARTTEQERRRCGLRDVALAAGKRLGEALRVLEEAAKTVHDAEGASDRFKALRYRAYDAEQRVARAVARLDRPRVQWRLCVLLTESLCTRLPWERVAQEAIRGGADCLQLREKSLPDGELLRRARRLVEIARGSGSGAAVVINDRPEIALLAGADGVHLGQEDLPIDEVRRLAGDALLIGVSTTDEAQAIAALRAGADVCGVGPMFPTTTKHKPSISGPAYLRRYLELATEHAAATGAEPVPHLAIGGVTPDNIRELLGVGCRGVAVSAAICNAKDPAAVCRALVETPSFG